MQATSSWYTYSSFLLNSPWSSSSLTISGISVDLLATMEMILSIDLLLTVSVLLTLPFPLSTRLQEVVTSSDPAYYYHLCSTSTCGNLSVPYPFAFPSFCGHPGLRSSCVNDDFLLVNSNDIPDAEPGRIVGSFRFDAAGFTVTAAYNSLFGCGPVTRKNFAPGRGPLALTLSNDYTSGTHLNCTRPPTSAPPGSLKPSSCLGCNASNTGNNLCFFTPMLTSYPECENFYVMVKEGVNVSTIGSLREYLRRGYEVRFTNPTSCRNCQNTGGKCGSSPAGYFICYCASSAHRFNCSDGMVEDLRTWFPRGKHSKTSKRVLAVVSASVSVASVVIIASIVVICVIRHRSKDKIDDEIGPIEKSVSETSFEGLVSGLSPERYSRSQIKKFTTNFSTMLGGGGFGSVYKGFIEGVGHVAVKVLDRSESKKQFMNEVATVGRVHHQNLVRLLGYSAQGKTRALVYEFMEKGSLDKYIYAKELEEHQEGKERKMILTSQQVYNIAMGTARGIMYLHEGCRSRILHLDIKPHNVLLDSNFSAKVADFGLARMFDKDQSHVSLTNAQGTPGYAAPEIWTKNYGPVTEKSDVYSYGMLLLEMAGRTNYDLGTMNSSQFYFPEWIFKKVERGELKVKTIFHEASSIEAEEEEGEKEEEAEEGDDILAKMCLVGLWCIQHIPSNRPTMSRVIEMLEGNVEIEIPPHPFPAEFSVEDFPSFYFTAME